MTGAEATSGAAEDWRSYLPVDCPVCNRHRLEYRLNEGGNVVHVRCEKCGWDSDD